MTHQLYPLRRLPGLSRWEAWMDRVANVLLVVGLGVLLGVQYVAPDKRVLSVSAAAVVVGVAWRLDMISGLCVAILAMPFPRGTTFGSTNLALILLLLVIYLLRIAQRQVAPPQSSPTDVPIVAFFLAYIVSFYNIENAHDFGFAFLNFVLLTGTFLFFFLISNTVDNEKALERLHTFCVISLLAVCLVGVYELGHPGGTLIPEWIEFHATQGREFNRHDIRIGSIFYDYELLADYCGLNLLLCTFLFLRARSLYRRLFMGGMLLLTMAIMFSTVTRGPLVSLSVALLFLVWRIRRHVRVVPATVIGSIVAALFIGMNFFVANFSRSGDLFGRVAKTQFIGLVPDSRVATWQPAFERMLKHPLLGWGPYYPTEHGIESVFWPHCLYLYVGNLTGFIGLGFFLWILWTFWKITTPRTDSLTSPSYTESYLLIAQVQLVFFIVDQVKIEYLRNTVYPYQVWLMFALWVAAYKLARKSRAAAVAAAAPA